MPASLSDSSCYSLATVTKYPSRRPMHMGSLSGPGSGAANHPPTNIIFVSHISEEAAIGGILKEWIEDAFPGQVECFVSSDPRDLPGGRNWLDEIATKLRNTDLRLLLSVLSPRSVSRPWISLEFGGAWIRATRIFPFCHSGLTNGTLPRPLGDFQGTTFEKSDACEQIINAVADAAGLVYPRRFDFRGMREALTKAIELSGDKAQAGEPEPARAAQPASRSEQVPDLPADALRILDVLVRIKNSSSDPYVRSSFLASTLNLAKSVCEVYLQDLDRRNLIHTRLNYVSGSTYGISEDGTRLLMALGRIK